MPTYLGQAVAKAINVRKESDLIVNAANHALAKPALLEGILKTYSPRDEEGERLPQEGTRVQATAEEIIEKIRAARAELWDACAARDFTNSASSTCADVVVDGNVLIERAPMPYLLWLDKQIDELEAFARRLPTLSAATTWNGSGNRGVYTSDPVETIRTITEQKAVPVFQPTAQHPGQAHMIQEQKAVGTWKTIKYSGAVPVERKEAILKKVAKLRTAVHYAREQVKRVEAQQPAVGARVFDYLFD